MKNIIHLSLLLLLCFSQSTIAEEVTETQSSLTLGINAHILDKNDAEVEKMINSMTALGFNMVRIDVPWDMVEIKRNQYIVPPKWDRIINNIISRGIEPLLILDYGNRLYNHGDKPITDDSREGFAKYAAFIVSHYSNVKYYQIWNEWDAPSAGTKKGTIDGYKELVKATYPLIKKANPNAFVLTGAFSAAGFDKKFDIGLGDYYRQYLSSEMSNFTDGVAVHPYTTYRPYPKNEYWFYLAQLKYFVDLVKNSNGFSDKPIFVTEIGWSTSLTKDGFSEEYQEKYLKSAICDAEKLGVNKIFLYDLKDDYPDRHKTSSGFGLYDYKWKPKPIVSSLRQLKCNK